MKKVISLVFIVFVFIQMLFSQVSITGPQCVTTGTVYQYMVKGKIKDSSSLRVCITGGKLDDSVNTCAEGMFDQVRVIWDDKASRGSVSISSPAGSSSLNVTITSGLNGGLISGTKTQLTTQDSIPVTIRCQAASGGGCSPVYVYQWEQSEDQANWKEIENETELNLKFLTVLSEPAFYRRKVTEINSGTIMYSDIASVLVIPKPTKK